ncbi:MAG: CO dehydrogenase/CO-methylating acetyl-CoA synthase complex subunit beta [Candidatus Abyssobacteria bacterium SURF_17]|uniref:CO-methylating acetyl-CoA synthase n=1 Tax=Candidatus Abyssobacteria bacterium SURF_17 TaxID=2093361 RepID=A0A419EUX4_9BACT|nr:MAG: CO dehydrogenase/CO-methylating acetyl-CoA synthase complex subunit beta [Candidatus Abyssubacteria bacterium SURF_17]
MSKIVASAAIRGAHSWVEEAEAALKQTIEEKSESQKLEFPETAFFLPMAYALLGMEVKDLGGAKKAMARARELLPPVPSENVWLPYLGPTLDAGISTLLATEMITALRYLRGELPAAGDQGFISDTILRSLGIQLVDGRMPGFAAILGSAPTNEIAVKVVRELQQRNILIFLCDHNNGTTMRQQLEQEKVELGWDTYIVPLGPDLASGIYALNWAMRGALTFGGHKRGEFVKCLEYQRDRVFAFGLVFGEVTDRRYAVGAGAINMGFCVIADTNIPEIRPSGVTLFEALVRERDYEKIVPTCIQTRGVKVKIEKVPIPVSYAAAFEGERVRKEQLAVEFGGKGSLACELLKMKPLSEVEDGKITVIGPDLDTVPDGKSLPLAIMVEVAGRKMQTDFEPILERQIHHLINGAMGVMHVGQRDIVWIRVSKDAKAKGFRMRHFGDILHAKLLQNFPAIADKVQVTIYTKKEDAERILAEARKSYAERDARVAGMTDESVDTFYSCTLCQSFAPTHVCIISPERLGLCGAYNWLDGKAAFEINPTGPNQPVEKGETIDTVKGQWENVNKFVYAKSGKKVERFNAYSMMEDPMTSCGCFECIVAIVPEANGIMIVNREYPGMTPSGMPFSTLASTTGGGLQTPGFLGVGKLYITSKKFISADGGLARIVWMPKQLKETIRERLETRAKELGLDDFYNKIADETVCDNAADLLPFLEKVGHPALTMPPMF